MLKTYTLRLTAKYTGAEYTNVGILDFTVSLSDPCIDANIAIDPAIITTLLPTSSVSYTLGRPAIEVGPFDTAYYSSDLDGTSANCPPYHVYTLARRLPLPSAKIWNSSFPTSLPQFRVIGSQTIAKSHSIVIETSDFDAVGEYEIIVAGHFTPYYLLVYDSDIYQRFTVEIVDPCKTAALSITP